MSRQADVEESRRIGHNAANALAAWFVEEYTKSVRDESGRLLDGEVMFKAARAVFDGVLAEKKPPWDGPPADPKGNGADFPPQN